MRQIILISLAALLVQGKTLGTSYILPTWEESATTSEFVGVVECIVAGGIVARYRVIDSWKGAPVGTELNISQHVDPFGPQFPVSFVGERSLAFAEKAPSYRMGSFSAGGATPLWWRKIPTDLRCFSVVPLKEKAARYFSSYMGYRGGDLDQFKADVIEFLNCDSEGQELRLMLAAARKSLHLPDPTEPSDKGNAEDIKLYDWLRAAKNVEQLWKRILERAALLNPPLIPKTEEENKAQNHKLTLLGMISDGGREHCKALLEQADVSNLPWDKKDIERAASDLRWNLSPARGKNFPPEDSAPTKTPTAKEILEAESALITPWDDKTAQAFDLLCHHSPGSLVPFLNRWQPSNDRRNQQFGYTLGSVFGHLCASDRINHLKALLSAKDHWIKVSAAVYLCFDDAIQGKEALSKLLELEGDAGAWAAIVLASRGEKAAMPRALEVIAMPDDQSMYSMNHHNLQLRLRVLLSNVASASGIDQPPGPSKEYSDGPERMIIHQQWHKSLSDWWDANKDRINLSDPWSSTLDKQKVD
ncbi:MAG: hypothetical protein ACK5TH_16175 [Prosthecobacter sp.]|jgi:hypothetical protein